MLRALPPGGEPIGLAEVFRALTGAGAGFEARLKGLLGVRHCLLLSSGTAALVVALRALQSLRPERAEVVLPAYTCPNVLAAVVEAGLRPVLADVGRNGSGFDARSLEARLGEATLAAIAVHLFGVPADIGEIKALAAARGAFVVEDAAQAFGNVGRADAAGPLGSLGDVGIFSFGRGKPLTLMGGGAAVTNSDALGEAMRQAAARCPRARSLPGLAGALIYALFFHPRLYWVLRGLPGLGLGKTVYPSRVFVGRISRFHAALGAVRLPGYEERRLARARRGRQAARLLGGAPVLGQPEMAPGNAYVRLPLLLDGPERDRLLARLGPLGATGMYPVPLDEQPDATPHLDGHPGGRYPNAKRLSQRLLTLPLHEYLAERDLLEVEAALRGATGAAVAEVS